MRETHYVLENGDTVHPSEVAPDKAGRLAHKNGLVQMRDDGETPRSRGVEVDEKIGKLLTEAKAKKPEAPDAPETQKPAAKKTVVMEPEPEPAPAKKAGYKTRRA